MDSKVSTSRDLTTGETHPSRLCSCLLNNSSSSSSSSDSITTYLSYHPPLHHNNSPKHRFHNWMTFQLLAPYLQHMEPSFSMIRLEIRNKRAMNIHTSLIQYSTIWKYNSHQVINSTIPSQDPQTCRYSPHHNHGLISSWRSSIEYHHELHHRVIKKIVIVIEN